MTPVRSKKRVVDGVLLLDKPFGMTSNKALQTARWHYHAAKAGHTGVLDPLASGLLPVCLGEATKFSAYLLDADKRYTASVRFGSVSTTGDLEGTLTAVAPPTFSADALRAALVGLLGEQMQQAPMHSALKHEGKALYEYARQGIVVPPKVRQITLHQLNLLAFDGETAEIDVLCSKGTYIRTLAEDLGKLMGCGAHLAGLRRTATAGFLLADALTLETLEATPPEARDALLLPPDILVAHLPEVTLTDAEVDAICHGQAVHSEQKNAIIDRCRLYAVDKRFIGLGAVRADGLLWPDRLLASAAIS